MDPDEALKRLRELAEKIDSVFGYDEAEVTEMVVTFMGLDGWLTRGGFLPKDWSNASA